MFNLMINVVVFALYVFLLLSEYVIMNILDIAYTTPWMVTTLFYILFIIYQVLQKINEDIEKGHIKEILLQIIDTANGIPLVNKNEHIIIKWDIIFKKLIDKKEYLLYDKIVKIKTRVIDSYVNRYPSLLFDNDIDMKENKQKVDLNSVVAGKEGNEPAEIKDLVTNEELKTRLFIKELGPRKAAFANFDSSILVDVILDDEFEADPEDHKKIDPRYDGFSVHMYYKNSKFTAVERTILYGKRIDKESWFLKNIDALFRGAESVVAGDNCPVIKLDEYSLSNYLSEYKAPDNSIPPFHLKCIEDNLLVFNCFQDEKEYIRVYCELSVNHNGFELNTKKYETVTPGSVKEMVELQKAVVIGSSYQPLVTILEKLPFITNNIRLIMNNKDLTDIVLR